jgi:hypothetical protein
MKLKLPLVNKIKHILPMFTGEFRVDMVGVKDDVIVSSIKSDEVTGDSNNEVLYVKWTDNDGKTCNTKFTEGNISKSQLINHTLVLNDYEGDEVTFRFDYR